MEKLTSMKDGNPGEVALSGVPVCYGQLGLLVPRVSVKPLAHVVAHYACCDGHKEFDEYFHL